jgi:glycosyltransferase domain-containing protein
MTARLDAIDQFTVLVPLKDRLPFTLRLMAYAANAGFPYRIFLADGSRDDASERALADPTAFPRVRYEYRRYAPDTSYGTYWTKLADALGRIQTPFVALLDNDDLLVASGARAAVEFMSAHDEYTSCGGQCAIFWIAPARPREQEPVCYGTNVTWKCSLDARSLDDETARERIRRHSLRATHPVYYHVRRTADLKRHAEIVRDLDLQDPFLIERLLFFLTAIDGKTQQLDSLYIVRQWNASGSDSLAHQARYGDWLGRMLAASWSSDFDKFVDVAASALAARDGVSLDEARSMVVGLYRLWLAPQLLGDLMTEPTVTLPMALTQRLVRWLLDRPEGSMLRRTARRLYRRTPWVAPDAPYGTELRARRPAAADDAFEAIRDFLAHPSGASAVH